MAASKIIYQTADYVNKEIERHSYPRFRVTVSRQQPKAQLNTIFDICVQSEEVISVLNLHVPGGMLYGLILVNDFLTLLLTIAIFTSRRKIRYFKLN